MTRLLTTLTIVASTFLVLLGASGRPDPTGSISGTIDLRTFSTTRASTIPPGAQVEVIVLPDFRHPVTVADLELDVRPDGKTTIAYTIPNVTLSDTGSYIVTVTAHPKNFSANNPAADFFAAKLHVAGKGLAATSLMVTVSGAHPNARANFGARGIQLPAFIGVGTVTGTIAFVQEAGPIPNVGSDTFALPAAVRVDKASSPVPIGFAHVGKIVLAADGTHVAHYTISNVPIRVPLRINVTSTAKLPDSKPSQFLMLTRFRPASAQTLGESVEVTLDAKLKQSTVDFTDYALEVPPMPPPPSPKPPTPAPTPSAAAGSQPSASPT